MPLPLLGRLSEGSEAWFYELYARVPGTEVRFGLHDGTALFVDGEPSVARTIAEAFEQRRLAK